METPFANLETICNEIKNKHKVDSSNMVRAFVEGTGVPDGLKGKLGGTVSHMTTCN